MKKTFDASRSIIALSAGGYIIEDGAIRHIEGHELPTAEDVLSAVRSCPEEIAADLLSVIADTGIPTVPDAPDGALCLRVSGGRGTVEDVEALSRIIAAGESEIYDLGYTTFWEEREPKKTTPPARRKSEAEGALEVILRLVEEGKEVFGKEPLNMTFPDYSVITKAISDYASELAYLLANELHVRSGQINAHDDVIERINAKKSTKEDIRALVEELVRVTADD